MKRKAVSFHGPDRREPPRVVRLRILGTTDLHMNILGFNYSRDKPEPRTGLAAASVLIERLRDDAENALLFDNGDFLQGTPLADYLALRRRPFPGEAHPAIAAMNILRYDAATLGNHDFDYGLDFLTTVIADAQHPVVSANVVRRRGAAPEQDRTLVPPFALLERRLRDGSGAAITLRIGVLGLAPPTLVRFGPPELAERIGTRDIVEAAAGWVPKLREAGADLVIALAHTGIGAQQHSPGMENAALPLARVDGIDAMLIGHTHRQFPSPNYAGLGGVDTERGTIEGTPAVMAGSNGTHIGVIDLTLRREGPGWRADGAQAAVLPVPDQPDPHHARVYSRNLRRDHTAIRTHLDRRIGWVDGPLHSYFALLGIAPATQLALRLQRSAAAEFLRDTVAADLPVLAAAAPAKAGGFGGPLNFIDIRPGAFTHRHLYDLLPFNDTLCALEVTGTGLHRWLEHAATTLCRLPGTARDMPLNDPRSPTYNFDIIDGIEYVIDPSRPPMSGRPGHEGRVVSLRRRGREVKPDDRFIVVTSTFRAAGGGGVLGDVDLQPIRRVLGSARQIMMTHLRDHDAAPALMRAAPPMRLADLAGRTTIFRTGPGAMHHLDAIAAFRPEPLGLDADGFLKLRLHL